MQDAHAEQNAGDESVGIETVKRFTTRVNIRVFHRRRRLADPDGLVIKAALDALTRAGILKDDSAKEIKGIYHEQIKISSKEEETTVIEITEV